MAVAEHLLPARVRGDRGESVCGDRGPQVRGLGVVLELMRREWRGTLAATPAFNDSGASLAHFSSLISFGLHRQLWPPMVVVHPWSEMTEGWVCAGFHRMAILLVD